MKPSIGRIVHYQIDEVDQPAATVPAIVNSINGDGSLNLTCFYPLNIRYERHVKQSDTPKLNHWNWPPREETEEPREIPDPGKPLPPQRYTGPAPIQLL